MKEAKELGLDWLDRRILWFIQGLWGERELGHFWVEFNPLDSFLLAVWLVRAWFRREFKEIEQ